MTWTTPKTWVTGEPLTAGDLNTHLRDNLNALKTPPTAHVEPDEAADFSASPGGNWVEVDATGDELTLTITTTGGDVLVHFHGGVSSSTAQSVYMDVAVDGARAGGDDGIVVETVASANYKVAFSFTRLITGLSAGSHTFTLMWYVSGGTLTLYAGAGASFDMHPQFWVREV